MIESQVETVDIMPTLLKILNLSVPQEVQGNSLISLIMDKGHKKESLVYSET